MVSAISLDTRTTTEPSLLGDVADKSSRQRAADMSDDGDDAEEDKEEEVNGRVDAAEEDDDEGVVDGKAEAAEEVENARVDTGRDCDASFEYSVATC